MLMKIKNYILISFILTLLSTASYSQNTDSTTYLPTISQDTTTLNHIITDLQQQVTLCSAELDSLYQVISTDKENSLLRDSLLVIQVEEIQRLEAISSELSDKITHLQTLRDSLIAVNETYHIELQERNRLLEEQIKAQQEKELLFLEKERIYQEALTSNSVDRTRLEGHIEAKNISIEAKNTEIAYLQRSLEEKDNNMEVQRRNYETLNIEKKHYQHLSDSLRNLLVEADKKLIKNAEQLKYTEQRAKEAEAKVAAATSRRKKVAAVQGIAMKTFRTPDWDIMPGLDDEGETVYRIVNRNAGSVEFDYIAGASVALWDLSKTFSRKKNIDLNDKPDTHDFSYSVGVYVGFGGSNLFKNFYAAPTFKFLDFFYLSTGINICEYEVLNDNVHEGDILPSGWSISDQVRKAWMVKFYVGLSLDLDFISYIKK